jgi:signal transduction histidine kinase
MKAYSLRLRLLAGAWLAIFVALMIAWFAMSLLFARHVEMRIEGELRREALQLVAGLGADAHGVTVRTPPRDARFDEPGSGLYWQISTQTGTIRSRSLWDQALGPPGVAGPNGWRLRLIGGPFENKIYVFERRVKPDASRPPVWVQVAEDEGDVRRARTEFNRELAVFLALLWIVLAAAAWLQVSLGLRPLKNLRAELLVLTHRPTERLSGRYPSEIGPLVDAINGLADAREADVRRAHQRAADLAHGLKTPLAALVAQSRLIASGELAATDGLDRAIASARASVETELARARAALSRHSVTHETASPAAACDRLIKVLERTDKGMRIDIVQHIPPDLRLRIDEADLTEILGALIENAVQFARRQVCIAGETEGDTGILRIVDDGPGLDAEAIERALGRGVRLDEQGSGHGFGLAIARDLLDATGGTIHISTAPHGGLAITLRWPLAQTGS